MKKTLLLTLVIPSLFLSKGITQTIDSTNNSADTTKSVIDDFKATLQETYINFDTAKLMNEMVAASNKLTLIAQKYSNEWAAQYYAAFGLTVLSYIDKDEKKRDAYIDKAEALLAKATELYKKDYDEVYVLTAMIANARLAVKPGSRYKKYGDIFNANIEKAKTLRADNPRIYYLQGTSVYYTPKFFGGGAKNAQPYFEKADALFQNEKGGDIYKPYWGKQRNTDLLKKCKDENK
jgi:hypothetical protein